MNADSAVHAMGTAVGDYNNDGFADIFVLRGGWFEEEGKISNSLLRNNGDATWIVGN